MTTPFITTGDLVVTDTNRIAWATARIRNYCGWHVAPNVSLTQTYDCDGSISQVLKALLVTAVTSVTDNVTYAVPTLIDPSLYDWSADGYLRALFGTMPWGLRALTVVYSAGYAVVPDDIAEITVNLAKRQSIGQAFVNQEAAGAVSHSFGAGAAGGMARAGFTAAEQAILDRYSLERGP